MFQSIHVILVNRLITTILFWQHKNYYQAKQ